MGVVMERWCLTQQMLGVFLKPGDKDDSYLYNISCPTRNGGQGYSAQVENNNDRKRYLVLLCQGNVTGHWYLRVIKTEIFGAKTMFEIDEMATE
jgi:hypothetical protein